MVNPAFSYYVSIWKNPMMFYSATNRIVVNQSSNLIYSYMRNISKSEFD